MSFRVHGYALYAELGLARDADRVTAAVRDADRVTAAVRPHIISEHPIMVAELKTQPAH